MTYFQVESLPVLYLFLFHSEFALQKENRKTIMVVTVIGFWNSLTFPRKNVILISDQINWIDIFANKSPKRKVSSFVIIKRTKKRWTTSHFPNISFSSDFPPRFKFPWLKAKSPRHSIDLYGPGLDHEEIYFSKTISWPAATMTMEHCNYQFFFRSSTKLTTLKELPTFWCTRNLTHINNFLKASAAYFKLHIIS